MQAAESVSDAGVTERRPLPARPDVPTAARETGQREGDRPVDPPHLGLIHLLHAGQHPLQGRPQPALISWRRRLTQRRGDVVVQVGVPVKYQRARQNPGRVPADGAEWKRDAFRVARGWPPRRPAPRRCSSAQNQRVPDWLANPGADRPCPRWCVRCPWTASPESCSGPNNTRQLAPMWAMTSRTRHPSGAAGGIPLLFGEIAAVVQDVVALRPQSDDPVICHSLPSARYES